MNIDWATILGNGIFVLIGALIGGGASYFGSKKSIQLQFENEEIRRNNIVETLLNTMLADEIKFNIAEVFMRTKGLKDAVDTWNNGDASMQFGFNSEKCLTTQFDKVEEILLSNPNKDTKMILDFYRFIKFYDVKYGTTREINSYSSSAIKEFVHSHRYFLSKFSITYIEK